MGLNIKNADAERLASEVASMTGESKTQAVKVALEERKGRLSRSATRKRPDALRRFLENEIWPQIPNELLGKAMTREEREAILGYGPEGV
jgi:antitoxin VapB